MSELLTSGVSLVVNTFNSFVSCAFNTVHPGFVGVSIGAVLVGLFMIGLGFDYIDFFLGANTHVKENKK